MIRPGEPGPSPWKPRTWAAATADPRYGSSPALSTIRPQRGSRAMSTIGANAQWIPAARASRAATAWPLLDRLGIPRRGHRDRHREDRAQTVDHVKPEQDRDPVPVARDGQPLQPVDLRRVGDEQQRADLPPGQRRLDVGLLPGGGPGRIRSGVLRRREAEVEVLGELPGLLRHRHLGDQRVNALGHLSVVAAWPGVPPAACWEPGRCRWRRSSERTSKLLTRVTVLV